MMLTDVSHYLSVHYFENFWKFLQRRKNFLRKEIDHWRNFVQILIRLINVKTQEMARRFK